MNAILTARGLPGAVRPVAVDATPCAATLRVGVTGHVRLTPASTSLIRTALLAALRELRGYEGRPVHGVTCLADGADQLFAEAVIAMRGTYDVVLPAPNYRAREIRPANRARFDRLLRRAGRVTYALPTSGRRAFASAGQHVLDRSDRLLAVWDGTTGGAVGGTADMVAAARRRGLAVDVVWPDGARRRGPSPRRTHGTSTSDGHADGTLGY